LFSICWKQWTAFTKERTDQGILAGSSCSGENEATTFCIFGIHKQVSEHEEAKC
jgi:hypothetical protein